MTLRWLVEAEIADAAEEPDEAEAACETDTAASSVVAAAVYSTW